VKGQSKLLGTGTADADDVVLTSSRDASFPHFRGPGEPGETTAAAADDWYAFRLDLEGCEHTSYGYVGCKQPTSSIAYTEIKYGRYGISIEDFCAPKLVGVEFSNITNNRHIYLNQSDCLPPRGLLQRRCVRLSIHGVSWDVGSYGWHARRRDELGVE
jgi:hypothetical protein